MNNEETNYNDLYEAGKETPTLDTKSVEDEKLYQTADGKHAKLDTDKGTEGKEKKNKSSIAAKASAASSKVEVPSALGTPEERMEQTLDALFDGENLTEEFMVKTATIFEAAINERVGEIESIILEHYEEQLATHIEEVSTSLAEKLIISEVSSSNDTLDTLTKIGVSFTEFTVNVTVSVELSLPSLTVNSKLSSPL